ncbi:two component transcriptional regulator, LytTR family [Pedobacter westerhofensis]|uniref:Two component transcriptional regulator, LytTR family n=1 Tax=Pedobacter westerhofensis TaxID=425512 RepID=A0A521D1L0_9SPHI|nr:LytTR family DNA-binding domain-containing protein [Pedobacter westerhofensis]SMO64891.1 two component transcriptional regulator, LytTR family [Pedobacter westerhofensis]
MKITCFIIDEDLKSIDTLKKHIHDIVFLELVGFQTKAEEGIAQVKMIMPDFVFLGIDVPAFEGVDFPGLIAHITKIVYISMFTEYAFEAFKHNAVDYLLKPVSKLKFMQCIAKIIYALPQPSAVPQKLQSTNASYIYLKELATSRLFKIELDDIFYIESNNNNVTFNLDREAHVVQVPLKKIISQLPPDLFLRIHKSFIVNHTKIIHIDGNMVVLKNKTVLLLGSTYKESFYDHIKTNIVKTGRDKQF